MYILKYKGRHVVRGNKEGMAPKIPDPSCTRRNLCVSDPGFLCYHISSLCRAVRHCPYYSLFSPVSQHYNVLIPGRKCLIGVNNTQTRSDPLRLRESSIYDVSELYVLYILIYYTQHNHQPTLSAITQCWDWWVTLKSSRHLDIRKEDKQSLFLKMKCQKKGCFLRTKMSIITSC